MTEPALTIRTPASSANLGAGFDVLGMAVGLYTDVGLGDPPGDAQPVDPNHPGYAAFAELGGTGPIWLRNSIPMARGLGFSGAVRVGAGALAVASTARSQPDDAVRERAVDVLEVAARLEGHADNVAASLHGGVTAYANGRVIDVPVGPVLAGSRFVAWIPDVTTSTDRSRRTLPPEILRSAAVVNIGASVQFALAFAHDDPDLLRGATADELHQAQRLPLVPDGSEALRAGVEAGAWCGWLSGSGPTVGFLAAAESAETVVRALPGSGHSKVLAIDTYGARISEG